MSKAVRSTVFAAVAVFVTLIATSAFAQGSYTWNQTGTGSWLTDTNWTPTRTTPHAGDVLSFNNGATTTVTNVPTQTVEAIFISANTAVTLQSAGAVTLTIAPAGGTDFSVGTGSQLTLSSTVAANAITIALAAGGSTGSISGSMTFTGAGGGTAHRFTALDPSGITFLNNSVFTQGAATTGNAFGNVTANSVVFNSGSKYVSASTNAANPFALTAPNSVVVFNSGSTFVQQGSAGPAFSNRTYANFEMNKVTAGAISVTGGTGVTLQNLIITAGTFNFNMTGPTAGTHVINGDITVAAGATLNFNPATAATVQLKGNINVAATGTLAFNPTVTGNLVLSGASPQSITNSGTLNIANANQTITIDNAGGASVLAPLTIDNGAFALTNGVVNTTAGTLTIGAAANITRTNGYVHGALKRVFGGTGSKPFPIGTPNGYSPFTASVTAGTFPADLTASATQAAQPNMPAGTSILRYWPLTANNVTSADLTFEYLNGDVQGNEAIYKVYRVSSGVPFAFPASNVDAGTNTATVTGITNFSDWTVGQFVDNVPPAVTSVNLPPNDIYVNGENLDFGVNFSEPVFVTGSPRIPITLTSGTVYANYVSGPSGPTQLFRYTVASGDLDADGIALGSLDPNGGAIEDASGNDADPTLNGVGSTAGILIDTVPPSVTATTVPADDTYVAGELLDFSVTYDENVLVTGAPSIDVTLDTGGTVQAVYNAGASTATTLVFRYTVASGNVDADGVTVASSISLNGGSIQDAAGNNAATSVTFGSTANVFVDAAQPTVVSITRVGNAVTNASPLDFTVEYSEDVTNVTSDAFTLSVTGTASGAIQNPVAVDGNTYTVTITSAAGEGTLRLDMHASGTGVTDLAGNLMNGGFNTGEEYTLDHVAATVTSVDVPANGTYTLGQNLDFTVHFSENVIVAAGTPRIEITEASGTVYATYQSGSGSNALLFRNTVVAGNSDPDGIVLAVAIDVNGATIRDAATNDANPTFNSVGSTTGVLVNANAPTVVSVTRVNAATTNLASVQYTVTFSETVTGVDSNDFSFTLSGVTGASVTGVTPATGDTYTVTVNTGSGDGTLRLNVDNDGSIQNGTSVPLGAAFTGGEVYTIDKTAPAVQSITRNSFSPANYTPVLFTVTFTEPTFNVQNTDFTSTMGGGVTGSSVIGISGTNGPYTLHVTTGSGDGTIRLDVVAASATINDAAGNALVANFNTGEVFTIDKTAPVVQSINRAGANPTGAATVDFTATFSETVSDVTAADFALATSGVISASIASVTGSGPYTITVNTGSGSGTIGLNLVDDDSIADTATNKLGGTGAGNGNFSGQVYDVSRDPLAPANLAATGGLDSHVPLTWDAANGAATYNVKRSPVNNTSYTTIATGVAVTNYDDLTAVNGTTYFYKVSGTNAEGEGPDSNEVSATPAAPLAAPSPVTVAVGDAKVILSWPAVAGATTYNVKRGTTSGTHPVVTNTAALTFTDSTVTNATPYFYVVTSVGAGESVPSSEVTATPNTPSVLGVVFSQVYGGGGNSGATLKNDFMELFNRGDQTVSLDGWSVQYSSSGGTFTQATALSGTIAPGRYYLVQQSQGAAGTVDLPTPDATGVITMSATAGKVALAGQTGNLGAVCTGAVIADLVGYGAAANCSETAPTSAPSNTSALLRDDNGCTDTNNNSADFSVVAQPLTVRNSGTPANVCGAVNNAPSITAPADPIASVSQDAAPFNVNVSGSDDGGVYTWSATPGTGVQTVGVTGGQGTATVTYNVTLVAGFSGTATFTASLSDGVNPPDTQAVNIQVTGIGGNNAPIITPPADPIATVAQDPAPFPISLTGSDDGASYNWTATPGTGVTSVNVTGGQGTANVTYTVTLNAGYSGTATFTASLSDNVNPPDTQAVNIAVTPAGGPPNHLVISQIYGGGGNSGATYKNDFVELYNPTGSAVTVTGWSIQYSSATNTGSFSGLAPLGGTIGPGEYYLIALSSGGAVGSDLPLANVDGSINMSATTGKVALVSNGDILGGPCATTLADTDIVDFVGYGTANCNEGGTNAPAPSNTTSTFRKNGGLTDTNINGDDFVAGAPNPRRTAGISEIGPAIVNTDPGTNDSNAPRDASIIVFFTEPVDVNSGWYDITCAITGNHNDATVAAGTPDSYVITPNVNFLAAEQCTVTIFKDFVHDTDLDDSNPNTDTLASNHTWTFTVSSGTPPPYPSSVHLTMGNPSDAAADFFTPNNYLMEKPEMAISYNADRGSPNWVSWHLTDEWVGTLTRVDTFRPDPAVFPSWYRVLGSDYSGSGFDRGHLVPNADRDKETSIPINQASFLMTNIMPQAPDNNQGPWADMENDLRTMLPANELYIVAGPHGTGGIGSNGAASTIVNGNVTVPEQTWKVVLILPKASGDDVARVTASTQTLAVLMPNIQGIRNNDWHDYIVTVDEVEALTGYDFFPNVPDAIENAIEAGEDGTNPPGAADQSVSTDEDVDEAITLSAASPSGTLTYTILTNPSNGSLSGSGASRTYTPNPDFNGSDSFTWKVNDGSADSNTATVTITVLEVNDPPSAANDSRTAVEDTPLTFNASTLTTNDSAGPANESGQTLTVTSVTATADTHGTVVLNAGQVTYTPAPDYTGPASFTYSVCDNGVTSGLTSPLCATATVNVQVECSTAPQPPAPISADSAVCAGSAGNQASTTTGGASYAWTITNGTITDGDGTSSILFTADHSGPIQLGVTITLPGSCGASRTGAATVQIRALPEARLPADIHACAGSSVDITATLIGTAPFTVRWLDGLMQTTATNKVTRRVVVTNTTRTYEIDSVADAFCTRRDMRERIRVIGSSAPVIEQQTDSVKINGNQTATLQVVTSTSPITFQWYQGPVGNTSIPVGSNAPSFTTPSLERTTRYWVRLTGSCGTTDSEQMTVHVNNRRRAVGHR